MVFDRDGHLLRSWGGPADPGFLTSRCAPAMGCEWPTNEHGIYVDHNDFVYIAGNGGPDNQVLKFTMDGTFVHAGRQGRPERGQQRRPAAHRTAVRCWATRPTWKSTRRPTSSTSPTDTATSACWWSTPLPGQYKRHWGAYGNVPNDADPGDYDPGAPVARQFRNPVHCVRIAKDGLVYVCDRVNNRYQVFQKNGTFVKEAFLERDTLGNGSMWDIDLSVDNAQRRLYNADGENNTVWAFDRESGQVLGSFGRNGRSAGQFHWVHNLALDSRGNIYTAEVDTGKRAQKFEPKDRGRGHGRDGRNDAEDRLRELIKKFF